MKLHHKRIPLYLISFSLLFLFLLQALSSPVFGARNRRNLLSSDSDYTAILYDSGNGLPTSEANAIAQTSDGFIWMGGYSGLILYDGTTFTRFDSSSGITSVYSLFVDSKDRVWIGTNENGVAVFEGGEIKAFGRAEGMKSYSIRDITEDAEGNILIATTQGIAYIDLDMQIHILDDPQINMEYITTLERDGDSDRIFGLTQEGAIFELEKLRIKAYYDPGRFGEDLINCIYPDPESKGIVYLGTSESEIMTVNSDDSMKVLSKRDVSPQSSVNKMLKTNGILWVACGNGIGYLDEFSTYHELTDSPIKNNLCGIMCDHEGNMWFTSTRQGVLKLVPDRFSDYSKLANLESAVVNSTCLSGDLLYIGHDTGLMIVNNENYEHVENEITEYLEGIRIRCIKADKAGNIWFATVGVHGLVCLKKNGEIAEFNETNGLDTNHVRDILELSNGSFAVSTTNGLFILKGGEISAHYDQSNGVTTLSILCVEEGPDGTLYLGSDGDGIYTISDNRVSRIGLEDGLTSGVIMRIKWDKERGVFWIITSNSIQYIQDGVIKEVKGFPYSNNLDIYFDKRGGAWVLSSNGVYLTTVEDLMKGTSVEYSFFNTKTGLPHIATGNGRSHLADDGRLFMACSGGVTLVNINAEPDSIDTVKLAIPSVYIDDRLVPVTYDETLKIPAGSKRVTINAYAVTYGLNNPRISYYLEGFENNPTITTKQELQPVTYTNLNGGKYVFHLNLLNTETGAVERTASLKITKEQSLYENPIFWILLMVAIIGSLTFMIYNYFRRKNEAIREKQEEEQRFNEQILHTFANCIDMRDSQNKGHSFRVAYYTKMLAEKLAEKREYTSEDIYQFYDIALLHDIGKLAIPDAILNKPSRLDDDEYEIMKSHTIEGEGILKDVNIVRDLAVGAGCHHERMDGKGYPHGLKGDEIPEVARIIAVADTFDAMYSTRPYRKQMLLSDVLDEIRRIRGTQLEEEVVDALLSLAEDGVLDREKVDEEVKKMKEKAASYSDGKTDKESKTSFLDESLAERNKEFLQSLGLHRGEKKDEHE